MPDAGAGARRPEAADLHAAEEWFAANGLPYFVDEVRRHVASRLTRSRLLLVSTAGLIVSVGSGILAGQTSDDVSNGISTGAQVLLVLALGYGLLALRGGPIAAWAGRRTFRSLGTLFQLATRALA